MGDIGYGTGHATLIPDRTRFFLLPTGSIVLWLACGLSRVPLGGGFKGAPRAQRRASSSSRSHHRDPTEAGMNAAAGSLPGSASSSAANASVTCVQHDNNGQDQIRHPRRLAQPRQQPDGKTRRSCCSQTRRIFGWAHPNLHVPRRRRNQRAPAFSRVDGFTAERFEGSGMDPDGRQRCVRHDPWNGVGYAVLGAMNLFTAESIGCPTLSCVCCTLCYFGTPLHTPARVHGRRARPP